MSNAPDIASHIELAHIHGKGRGVQALCKLPAHTLIALNWPLVDTSIDNTSSMQRHFTTSMDASSCLDTSQVQLRAKAVNAAGRDPLAATTLSSLDDSQPGYLASDSPAARELPLVQTRVLQQVLSPRVLPLLPQWGLYFPQRERVTPSAPFIDRVCTVNSHGTGSGDVAGKQESGLFPLVSLFNHARAPNCTAVQLTAALTEHSKLGITAPRVHRGAQADGSPQGRAMVVVTRREICKGEELTVLYHGDPKVVRQKWNIE